MTDIHVIQPQEMGSDFEFDTVTKKWKLKVLGVNISTDANNILTTGSDLGVYLDSNKLKKYHLIQDNLSSKYRLYSFTTTIFNVLTATLISEVDMGVIQAQLDDISITPGSSVITFADSANGETIVFDTSSPIFDIFKANTNAIQLSGNGKNSALNATLIVDPSNNNILKVTVDGASVNKQDILSILNSNKSSFIDNTITSSNNTMKSVVNTVESEATIINSMSLTVNNLDNSMLKLSINGVETTLAVNQLKNTNGDSLGFTIDQLQ